MPRILWIKSGPLLPLDSGGKIRTHAMLCALAQHTDITYLALHNRRQALHPDEEAAPYAARKRWIPWRETPKRSPAFYFDLLRNAAFSRLPYALEKYRSPNMTAAIAELAPEHDLVICDFLFPALSFPPIESLPVPTVLFQHNVEAEIWRRLSENQANPLARRYLTGQYRRMRRAEAALSKSFDGVIAVSEEDASHFRDRYGLTNVLGAVPTGVDTEYFSPQPEPSTPPLGEPPRIGFLGSMDWLPNIDAVTFYAREVLPKLFDSHPNLEFLVIGRNPAPSLLELQRREPRISFTGTVDDVRPHLHRCHHLVVPLRAGGGTRIKIYEAMALGLPIVSTRIGAEGLAVADGEDILLADTPDELAVASRRLLDEATLSPRLALAARQRMERDHNWPKVTDRFLDLCHPLFAKDNEPTHLSEEASNA